MRPLAFVVLFAASALAAMHTDFKTDSGTLLPEVRAAFLQSICPGHAGSAGCDACPSGTSFPQDSWHIEGVIFGHFRSATSDDAILTGSGCEPHSSGLGGSYLFTREGSGWRKIWYKPGYPLSLCKRLPASDGRDLLACENSDMHQGVADTFLYLFDPGADEIGIFFGINDSLGSCVKVDGSVVTGEIESVAFVGLAGRAGMRIRVGARLGKASIPDRVLEQQCDGKGGTPIVRTVPLRYQFVFDGTSVKPIEGNPGNEHGWAVPPRTSYSVR